MADLLRLIDDVFNKAACDLVIQDTGTRGDTVAAALAAVEGYLVSVDGDSAPLVDALSQARSDVSTLGAAVVFERVQATWNAWKDGARASAEEPPASSPAPADAAGDRLDADAAALAQDPDFATMFVTDSLEHLGTIESAVLALESAPEDVALINGVFRPFHTVKGNAGAVGVTSVQELAHKAENLLDLARSGKHRLSARDFDIILKAVDLLTAHVQEVQVRMAGHRERDLDAARAAMIEAIERCVREEPAAVNPEHEAASTTPVAAAPVLVHEGDPSHARRDDQAASVKVDTRKLDNLIDMVGELVIAQAIVEQDASLGRTGDERSQRNLAQLRRITTDLQRTAMSMRMVPIRQTFQKMSRLVRDLGKKSGKVVELTLVGEETELDRRLVEDIADPLMHMVRNSIDHGIEDGDTRERAGKPRAGHLTLSAYHKGGDIVIAIADDGAGLPTEKILAKALKQGIVSATDQLAPADIHQLIFKAGFSTAEKVTDISGRGVGMDVVRGAVETLRGRIDIQTATGKGTTFLMRLPLTLAIVDGLLMKVGRERFVVPTFAVAESLRAKPEQVHSTQGVTCVIKVRNQLLPLVRLADLFGIDGATIDPSEGTIVVMEGDGRQIAVMVDSLIGKQEVVIKSLGPAFTNIRGVAGCAILGDGHVGLILDAHSIVRSQHSGAAPRAA